MKKKFLSLILALSLLTMFIPTMTGAEERTKYGDYLYYKINSDNTAVTITACDKAVTEVEIPAEIDGLPVTSIGNSAFSGCKSLTDITIPDSVITIGEGAFFLCEKLTGITIPESVTTIDDSAFEYCSSLTDITIPDNVTAIGIRTFFHCKSLTGVTIPNSVTSIGHHAFDSCPMLKDVYYNGTGAQWKAIAIAKYNEPLLKAKVNFAIADTTPDTYEISSITLTDTEVKFTVTTKETVSGTQTLIAASYDERGVFINLETRQITASDEPQNISIDIDTTGAKTVKAFIWNSMEYMMPASNAQSVEL